MIPLLRIAVIGATGAVGGELISLLEERRFPLQDLKLVASDRSLGEGVDVLDQDIAVETELATLAGLDCVFVCTPQDVALDWVRRCLRDEIRCIDLSGGMVAHAEVPLLGAAGAEGAPLVAVPPPAAIALARVVGALAQEATVTRVNATWLVSAAAAGRLGVDALQAETIALFNQDDTPETDVFGREIAFDAWPGPGEPDESGATPGERGAMAAVERLLPGISAALSAVQVPVFAGLGLQLTVDFEPGTDTAATLASLAKADGVALATSATSTRDALGSDDVHVSRVVAGEVRPDTASLRMWIAADPIRLATLAAVTAAEPRDTD
jgi:aspartate-semialdehyde dehydrogenase